MIGPSIPKELLEKKQAASSNNDHSPSTSPPHSPPSSSEMAGPMLPPEMKTEKQEEESDDDSDAFTPALPPDLLQARQEQKQEQQQQQETQQRRRRAPVGPSLPSQQRQDDDEDDFAIGPVLPTGYDPQRDAVQSTIQEVAERLESSKTAMEEAKHGDKNKKIERGEWMLVPPEIDYLRGADSSRSRGFNQRNLSSAERDRSVWTDTPAERERKQRGQESQDAANASSRPLPPVHSRYDEDIRRNVQQYNNTERAKSLMEIHREMGGRASSSSEPQLHHSPASRTPASPPQSTYSEDSGLHPSPYTDAYDNFGPNIKQQQPTFATPDQMITDLIFPEDTDMKAEYNQDFANRLCMLENALNTGSVSPQDMNINIANEQELANVNAWLARLTGSIPDNYVQQQQQPVVQDQQKMMYNSMYGNPPTTTTSFASTPTSYQQTSSYDPSMMLQSFTDPTTQPMHPQQPAQQQPLQDGNMLYPSAEQDLYVRSHPIPQQSNSVPPMDNVAYMNGGFDNMMSVDYSAQAMSLGYGASAMDGNIGMTTGFRHHYTAVPDVTMNGFTPDIRTATNFTSANSKSKRNAAKTPSDGAQVEKDETKENIKPTKAKTVTYEDKKNVATLFNVFTSIGESGKPSSSSKSTKSNALNEESTKEKDESENAKKEEDDEEKKQSSPVKKDVVDLLVSDLSELDIKEKSKPVEELPSRKVASSSPSSSTTLYPNSNSLPTAERHRLLLNQIRQWVNDSYAMKNKTKAPTTAAPYKTSSVSVQ